DPPADAGWTLAPDVPALKWMAKAADLRLIALDGELRSYALVCPRAGEGRGMEILAWREQGGSRAALRLLAAVVGSASAMGNVTLGFSHTAARDPEERER